MNTRFDQDTLDLYEYQRSDLLRTMENHGTVFDQETSRSMPYDAQRVSPLMQVRILHALSDPDRTVDGHKTWPVVVTSRQAGKSYTVAAANYLLTGYTPGSTGAIITDTRERSDTLFKYINDVHYGMPLNVRPMATSRQETRQITFVDKHNDPTGSIKTYSAGSGNMGIGRSWDYSVISEVPFIDNMADLWYKMRPAVTNRKEASVVFESTPAPLSEPSAEFYKNLVFQAMDGTGRFRLQFTPYFQSRLNERAWQKEWRLTNEEIAWLQQYGPTGIHEGRPINAPGAPYLTLENLAFRRRTMEEDPEIRRHPNLFNIFYPMDIATCWQHSGQGSIPRSAIEAIRKQIRLPWKPDEEGLQWYVNPNTIHEQAVCVLAVDPSGHGTGDCAAFQLYAIWDDEWEHLAQFSSRSADPLVVARIICEVAQIANNAHVVVENNGVGAATLTHLKMANTDFAVMPDKDGLMKEYHLKRLYYHKPYKPGIAASKQSNKEAMAALIDAMLSKKLKIRCDVLFSHVADYRRDSEVKSGETSLILNQGKTMKGRRDKHHWDRVSALLWLAWAATHITATRYKPKDDPEEGTTGDSLSYREFTRMEKAAKAKRRKERSKKWNGRYRS
jgi:hypothetical protein